VTAAHATDHAAVSGAWLDATATPDPAAVRACDASTAAPPCDLAYLVALDLARIAESRGQREVARAALVAQTPAEWLAVARGIGLGVEAPLLSAAVDSAMLSSRGRVGAAADALAIARGQTLRQWCGEMRAVRL